MAFNFFGSKSENFFGVDIGTSSIKIVELSSENGRPKLENYGILDNISFVENLPASPLPLSGILPTGIFFGQAAEMTKRLAQKSGIKLGRVNMSVPIFSSFLTLMDLPAMSETEVAQAIQFEAKEYIPIPLEQVVLDWTILGQAPQATDQAQGQSQRMQVLLIAIPKDLISEYTKIASQAGFELAAIELETASAARVLVSNDPTPVALLDIGARSSTVSIVDQGFLQISHAVETSGEDITRALAQGLNISSKRAEQLKRERGLRVISGEGEISSIVTPLIDVIISNVKNIMDIHSAKTGHKVEKLIIYGGMSSLIDLDKYLAQKLNLDISVAAPFKRIVYPQKLEPIINNVGVDLTIALGLALRDFK